MRIAPVVAVALVASLVVAAACGGDDSSNGGNSVVPPSACVAPCTPGAPICSGPVEPNCNGSWYCWSDSTWHCAPPDSGGPADATLYEAAYPDDGPDEAAEASPATDASDAGPG